MLVYMPCAWNLYLILVSVIYRRHKCLIRGKLHGFNFVNFSSGAESHKWKSNGTILVVANRKGFHVTGRQFTKCGVKGWLMTTQSRREKLGDGFRASLKAVPALSSGARDWQSALLYDMVQRFLWHWKKNEKTNKPREHQPQTKETMICLITIKKNNKK